MPENKEKTFESDRILSYFQIEWRGLLAVTISGLIYNLGLIAGPWFEGKMTGCLVDILKGTKQSGVMLYLVTAYVAVIAVVQISRYIKRFYVRRFANNVNRRMKQILYRSLVLKSRASLREEGEGDIMTKAILDVDDCAEGMRKFTTEIFDTGVALAAYAGMLLWYDWRLALLCMIFPPVSYITAEKMKKMIQRTGAAYKKQSGELSSATLDRVENAMTYRVFGCEKERPAAYEKNLTEYEQSAVKANIWNSVMPPVYRIISMSGVLFILYFGQKNVLGNGWKTWNIAAFTTNQRIIAGNAQFTGIAAGRGVGFTTGLLLLRKGLGMRETPIRPHSWHCRMQSGYQYGGNRKRPPVWRRHRGSLRPRGRNLGGVEGMTGGCGSGCDPAIHTRRLRVYHRPRRLRMASRISIFFAARRFEPLNSMG